MWKRLDVPKGHRDELARLTGIPATNLSGMNTGRLPMTREAAERIVAAVPGVTVADLGAPLETREAPPPLSDRLATLEARVDRLYVETTRGFEALGHLQHGLVEQEEDQEPRA